MSASAPRAVTACALHGPQGAAGGPSIVEIVCGPSGLEVYERAGEGAVDALEDRLRRLGLRLIVRRRAMCG